MYRDSFGDFMIGQAVKRDQEEERRRGEIIALRSENVALKEENERLKQHVADLNADFNSSEDHCRKFHVEGE